MHSRRGSRHRLKGIEMATVYTVHAYRYGNRERHSYIVGVYSKKHAALKAASTEEEYRGGKYECEVLEWSLDSGMAGRHEGGGKTVKPLSDISILRAKITTQPAGGTAVAKD